MDDGVWIFDLNIFLRFYFFVFSLILVSIEKIYHTQNSIYHIFKNLEVRQKIRRYA